MVISESFIGPGVTGHWSEYSTQMKWHSCNYGCMENFVHKRTEEGV